MKKIVKYFSMFLLVIGLSFGIVGCNKDKEDDQEKKLPEQPTTEPIAIEENEELIMIGVSEDGEIVEMIANNRFSNSKRARYELYGHFKEDDYSNTTDAGAIEIIKDEKAIINSLGEHLSFNYTLVLDKEYYKDKLPYQVKLSYVLGEADEPETDLTKVKGYDGQVKIIISIIANETYPDVIKIMPQGQVSFDLGTTEIVEAVGAVSEIRQGNALELIYMGIPGKSIDYEIVVNSKNFRFGGVNMMFQRFDFDIIERMIPSLKDLVPEDVDLSLKAEYFQMINLALNQVTTASDQVAGTSVGLTSTGLSSYNKLVELAQTIAEKAGNMTAFSGALNDLNTSILSLDKSEVLGYLDQEHANYEENKKKLEEIYDLLQFRSYLISGANYDALTSVSRATSLDKLSDNEQDVNQLFGDLGEKIGPSSTNIKNNVITELNDLVSEYEEDLQAPIPFEDLVENKNNFISMIETMVDEMKTINTDLQKFQNKLGNIQKASDQAANALRAYDAYVNISDALIDLENDFASLKLLLDELLADDAILAASKDKVQSISDDLDLANPVSILATLKGANEEYTSEIGKANRETYKDSLSSLQIQVQNAQLAVNGLNTFINGTINIGDGKEIVFMQAMFIVELISKVFPYLPEDIDLGPDVMNSFLDKDNNPAVGALQFVMVVKGV